MENKYYTPSIEEFHVGFEFEAINTVSNLPNKDKWESFEMGLGLGEQWTRIENYINSNLIRVKFLDKEDIESLGFVIDPSGERYFELDDYQLNLDIHPVYNVTIFTDKYGDTRMVFQGTIKNKSELKQILKMIGVTE